MNTFDYIIPEYRHIAISNGKIIIGGVGMWSRKPLTLSSDNMTGTTDTSGESKRSKLNPTANDERKDRRAWGKYDPPCCTYLETFGRPLIVPSVVSMSHLISNG